MEKSNAHGKEKRGPCCACSRLANPPRNRPARRRRYWARSRAATSLVADGRSTCDGKDYSAAQKTAEVNASFGGRINVLAASVTKALAKAGCKPRPVYRPYLPPGFPKWNKAVDGLEDAGICSPPHEVREACCSKQSGYTALGRHHYVCRASQSI